MLNNSQSSKKYIRKIEKLLSTEKIREKQTLEELYKIKNYDKSHTETLENYLKQIKLNILKLNTLLEKIEVKKRTSSLNISKLANSQNQRNGLVQYYLK